MADTYPSIVFSCLAVNDLLRGRPLDDVVDSLPELWESSLRVRDDIKESVRNAADLACKTLSRVRISVILLIISKIYRKKRILYSLSLLHHSAPKLRTL